MNQSHIAELERQVEDLARDATRLRSALDAARAERDALARAAAEWETLFEALPDLVSVIDCDHRIVRVNRRMADRLNVTMEEAVGRPCYELVHASGAPPAFCPHTLALEDGRAHSAEIYEPTLDAFFLVSASPLSDSAGRVVGSVHIVRELPNRRLRLDESREGASEPRTIRVELTSRA